VSVTKEEALADFGITDQLHIVSGAIEETDVPRQDIDVRCRQGKCGHSALPLADDLRDVGIRHGAERCDTGQRRRAVSPGRIIAMTERTSLDELPRWLRGGILRVCVNRQAAEHKRTRRCAKWDCHRRM
jgi:hypothetical protein